MINSNGNKLPKVCILLSIYNGTQYLRELLISLACQQQVCLFIHARDDLSSDDSAFLFQAICDDLNVPYSIINGVSNLGPSASFFELIRTAPTGFDYYALCDQDDYWLQNKLSRAVGLLASFDDDRPVLYASAVAVTGPDLEIVRLTSVPILTSFSNALIENHVTGCTAVVNQAGMVSLAKLIPKRCIMHDWWMYLHFSAFGNIVLDAKSSILYRQHGNNQVGMTQEARLSLAQRMKRHLKNAAARQQLEQAEAFHRLHGDQLPKELNQLLLCYLKSRSSFIGRLWLVFDRRFHRKNRINSIIWRILVLLNRH